MLTSCWIQQCQGLCLACRAPEFWHLLHALTALWFFPSLEHWVLGFFPPEKFSWAYLTRVITQTPQFRDSWPGSESLWGFHLHTPLLLFLLIPSVLAAWVPSLLHSSFSFLLSSYFFSNLRQSWHCWLRFVILGCLWHIKFQVPSPASDWLQSLQKHHWKLLRAAFLQLWKGFIRHTAHWC